MPNPPTGCSALVREAYQGSLSRIRCGLTDRDVRQLRAAVRRGELCYRQDLNMPGRWMQWLPAWPRGG